MNLVVKKTIMSLIRHYCIKKSIIRDRKTCENRLLASACLTVRPFALNNLASTGLIFINLIFEFDVWLTVHRNSVWIRKTN